MNFDALIGHLERLVSCDSQNPPRTITGDSEMFRYCSDVVGGGFDVRIEDHGDGHVSWFAVRGKPDVLFNVHLDTVPVADGWTRDPFALEVENARAYGLGACDIKGAAAALLAIAEDGPKNLALLFTSDEEGAGGCCVKNFLESGQGRPFGQVVVAEPTACGAVLGHRGFLSVKTRFSGRPGHSSESRALADNANHQAARWANAALGVAESKKRAPDDPGSCMNIGIVDGGSKSNVIAAGAFVHWSARLRPGDSNDAFLDEMKACVPAGSNVDWEVPFKGEPLPAAGRDDLAARAFCKRNGLEQGPDVNFWTEASLFSRAGLPAIVLGPGDIAQAHAADEWVEIGQLEQALACYGRMVMQDG